MTGAQELEAIASGLQAARYKRERDALKRQLVDVIGKQYDMPAELIRILEMALDLPPKKRAGRDIKWEGWGGEKWMLALYIEIYHQRWSGGIASAYVVARDVNRAIGPRPLSGISHNTIQKWRERPEYRRLAFEVAPGAPAWAFAKYVYEKHVSQ